MLVELEDGDNFPKPSLWKDYTKRFSALWTSIIFQFWLYFVRRRIAKYCVYIDIYVLIDIILHFHRYVQLQFVSPLG